MSKKVNAPMRVSFKGDTKLMFGPVRLSFAHVWEPRKAADGADPKYETGILIKKSDKKIIEALEKAVAAAEKIALAKKWDGEGPTKRQREANKPIKDGDEYADEKPSGREEFRGHMFLNARSKTAPQIVDASMQPVTDRARCYSGCYVYITIDAYGYNTGSNKGITWGLGNILTLNTGERLSGGSSDPDKDFEDIDLGDFLDDEDGEDDDDSVY